MTAKNIINNSFISNGKLMLISFHFELWEFWMTMLMIQISTRPLQKQFSLQERFCGVMLLCCPGIGWFIGLCFRDYGYVVSGEGIFYKVINSQIESQWQSHFHQPKMYFSCDQIKLTFLIGFAVHFIKLYFLWTTEDVAVYIPTSTSCGILFEGSRLFAWVENGYYFAVAAF